MNSYVTIISFTLFYMTSLSIADNDANSYKSHTPEEFIEIMNDSSITYSVVTDQQNIKPFSLVISNKEPYSINPFSRTVQDHNGRMILIQDEPKGEIKTLFESAAEKLKQKHYEEVATLYKQALELDKSYFKTWTNLGDTYYALGQYDMAEKFLLKAVELNNIGYQEYYFLADTYDKMNNNQKALECITHAYMLNKGNPNIPKSLHRILKNNNLHLRTNRLEFPFEIKKINNLECEIIYAGENALNWMPMANCLACWQMEPQFQKLLNDKNNAINMKIAMYKECILSQAAIVEQRMQQKETVTEKEQQLCTMVKDNYLNAVLYWEVIAGESPQIILLLPREEQNRIIDYIKKFVYENAKNPLKN